MATHSSILPWRIPGTGEPGRLQPMELQRVRHDLATTQIYIYILRIYIFLIWSWTLRLWNFITGVGSLDQQQCDRQMREAGNNQSRIAEIC